MKRYEAILDVSIELAGNDTLTIMELEEFRSYVKHSLNSIKVDKKILVTNGKSCHYKPFDISGVLDIRINVYKTVFYKNKVRVKITSNAMNDDNMSRVIRVIMNHFKNCVTFIDVPRVVKYKTIEMRRK